MKKLFATLLAGLMAFSMVACAGGSADTTTAGGADGNTGATTAATTTKRVITTPAPAEPSNPDAPEDWTILEAASDWHYKMFSCPFDRDNGAIFPADTDEMAKWLAEQGEEWYKDADLIAEMATWPTQTAPMGDRHLGLGDNNSPIGWANEINGIICYQQIELTAEQIASLEYAAEDSIYMDVFYDNAFYVYINGTLVFSDDANGGEGDWNEAMEPVDFDVSVKDLFVEGKNDIIVTLKNCWGGREFIMSIECLYY
ncbi:MAG: hypothetical protein IJW62_05685 [Clostridia bacterium]|nr:hypothetical protein [Clostridia bacterium]